jgi:hypothetical protein
MSVDIDITATEDDVPEEKFDFSSWEDVLIEIVPTGEPIKGLPFWDGYEVEWATVIGCQSNDVTGAASYAQSYGGYLDYICCDLIECPGEGWWVIERVTGRYFRGDGWTTDDDMDFYCEGHRPATEDEINAA